MNKPMASALERVTEHWDRRARDEQTDCARVDASLRAQRMRFEAFVVHHNLAGKTVLDVGCGVGDFWAHLRQRGISCKYVGTDISSVMVDRSRERFPGVEFLHQDILEWDPGLRFDYVVAFGIHNVKFEGADLLLESITRRQFELCEIAAHTSILTDRYPGFGPQAQAWRAEQALTLALGISPYTVLRHDYLPNDFSLTLYRKPLIDTHPGLVLE